MPTEQKVALEYFRVLSEASVFSAKSFMPSKGKSSTVNCTSFRKPDTWSHDACHITTAMEMDLILEETKVKNCVEGMTTSSGEEK